jgi:hypothetical protein
MKHHRLAIGFAALTFVILLALACIPADAAPGTATITFRKVFKSSYPEFVEICIKESGAGTFDIRQLDEEATPQPFEVSRSLAGKVFQLADQLHHFQNLNLDVHRRVANLGQKTFRYEKDGESSEVTFNYTIDAAATQLLGLFEGLARQQTDLSDLQRTMHYDRLGINNTLVHVEADFNARLLPEPERFLPLLDQLAADSRFLDIARQKARALAEQIRNPR